MTRKPKSAIARWREEVSEAQRDLVLKKFTGAAFHFYSLENTRAAKLAIAVLKHAARKRKVK